ncbi:MAG: hypothetical protein U0354_18530 [Candidatus Sericytochromatia bacterium]
MSNITKQLEQLTAQTDNALTKYVAEYLLESGNDEEIKTTIRDILEHGCVSGIVSELIYYKDTHDFFDKFYNEIETLRYEYERETGENLKIESDLKNFLAWFGFEQTVYNISFDLGLE